MTYKELILRTLRFFPESTCATICRKISTYYKQNDNRAAMNATVSSILKKMIRSKILKYGFLKGPQGGKTYKII